MTALAKAPIALPNDGQTPVVFRKSRELVIAFSGPVGSGHSSVINQFRQQLEDAGYKVFHIKLSSKIENAIAKDIVAVDPEDTNRYLRLQTGGNKLRKQFGNDILAKLAIAEIATHRLAESENPPEELSDIEPTSPLAFLIDQLKHPEEAKVLKDVYENIFFLIGIFASEHQRERVLLDSDSELDRKAVATVMDRDRNENEKYGQKLDKTLHLADYFIRNTEQETVLKQHVDRFVKLAHGYQVVSPTIDEYGMYVAFSAGLRSACLSRQVGAAIAGVSGEIIATGCNDVPRPEGGLYTPADGSLDRRCFQLPSAKCFNDQHKSKLEAEIRKLVRDYLSELELSDKVVFKESKNDIANILASRVREFTRVRDLIEFSRSVHAEMDALISLARIGGTASHGATLYSTVFPCHSCARHIVAAGIARVVFIEPYEKSLANVLHSDAISVDRMEKLQTDGSDEKTLTKSAFVHFEGVAPTKYSLLFMPVGERKEAGKLRRGPLRGAETALPQYYDPYTKIEIMITKTLSGTGLEDT